MHKITFKLWSAAILVPVFALTANASLIGTSVSGSLTFAADSSNYFDPGYGFVPAGYLNGAGTTVTVSNPAVEFGYDDGASLISADFSGRGLTISDQIELSGLTNSFQLTFMDAAFAGQTLIPVSDSFPLTSYSIAADLITLDYAGGNERLGQRLTASLTVAPAPEPSTFGFLGVSILSFLAAFGAATLRRKGHASEL